MIRPVRVYEKFTEDDGWYWDIHVPAHLVDAFVAYCEKERLDYDAPREPEMDYAADDAMAYVKKMAADIKDPAKHAESYEALKTWMAEQPT